MRSEGKARVLSAAHTQVCCCWEHPGSSCLAGGMGLCRALCGDAMWLSAARGMEQSPAALSWARPTVREQRSPGLVVALGLRHCPGGRCLPPFSAQLSQSRAVSLSRQSPPDGSWGCQGLSRENFSLVLPWDPCFGWPCHTQRANGVNAAFFRHSPEQMTAAVFPWEHGEAPRVITGHCARWASVPSQWKESLQTGPVSLPKCSPPGMASANPQLS